MYLVPRLRDVPNAVLPFYLHVLIVWKSCEPQTHATLRACPGLYWDSFTFCLMLFWPKHTSVPAGQFCCCDILNIPETVSHMQHIPHVLAHTEYIKTLLHVQHTISACNTHPTTTAVLHTEHILSLSYTEHTTSTVSYIQVSQEECARLRENVPQVKLYRYNPKHLYPKFNGYGDIGQRKVWTSLVSAQYTLSVT